MGCSGINSKIDNLNKYQKLLEKDITGYESYLKEKKKN